MSRLTGNCIVSQIKIMNETITAVEGIVVGHAQDLEAITGVTVVLCKEGAVGGVDMRGTATGSREINPLDPLHLVERVHGICLAGGSAFGLDAAGGVMQWLEERGIGFNVGPTVVPIVPSAILFDLRIGDHRVRPDAAMAYRACEAASGEPALEGCVGAGTGATIGKLLGPAGAMKSGIGSWSVTAPDGLCVGAIAAVNAFGDVLDPETGKIIAGCRNPSGGGFIDTAKIIAGPMPEKKYTPENTTLVVVATNAALTKSEAQKVSQMAQIGMAKTVSPCHSTLDGDTIFTIATGKLQAAVSLNRLGVLAALATATAILRAVKTADPMAGLPAWKSLSK